MLSWRILSFAVLPLLLHAQPATLNRLLDSARENNKDLAAAWKLREEASALRQQAALRPVASAGFTGASGKLTANPGESEIAPEFAVPIETGGKRSRRIAVAEAGVSLASAAAEERLRRLIYEVKLRYADASAEQLRLAVTLRLLEILQRDLALTTERVSQGDASELSRRLLEVEVARLNAALDLRRGRTAAALAELGQIVGWPAGQSLEIVADLNRSMAPPTAEELIARSLEQRPDLRALRIENARALKERDLARADGYPTVTASVRYSWERQALGPAPPLLDSGHMLFFGVSVPLTTPKRTQGLQNAASARAEAANLQAQQMELAIRSRITGALLRLEKIRGSLTILERQVMSSALQNLNVVRDAYQLGELRIQDVLLEQRRYLDMELDRIQAQYETFVAAAELELEVGGDLP